MKHIKLFEEYKYFNIGDFSTPKLVEPTDDRPYYTSTWSSGKSSKDKNEPFFTKNKMKYKNNKFKEINKNVEELNRPIVMDIAQNKMKISPSEFEELEGIVRRDADNCLIHYSCDYIKDTGYYNLMLSRERERKRHIFPSVHIDDDEDEYGTYLLNLLYFVEEDDYIINGKNFKTIKEVINYLKDSYVSQHDKDEKKHKKYRAYLRGEQYD